MTEPLRSPLAGSVDGRVGGWQVWHPELPAGALSPQWLPIFSTTATDAAVAQVRAGGGGVVCEPFDTDFGRMAILRDAESAPFSVIQLG